MAPETGSAFSAGGKSGSIRERSYAACLVMPNSEGYDRDVSVHGELMEAQQPDKDHKQPKISVHVCPQCGFAINSKDLGLRACATGVVTCPMWPGQDRSKFRSSITSG